MSADRFQAAALDLLNRGGCSVPILAGEFVKRRYLSNEKTISHAYAIAQATLTELVGLGKASAWHNGCFSLPGMTPMETHPPTDSIHKRRDEPVALERK